MDSSVVIHRMSQFVIYEVSGLVCLCEVAIFRVCGRVSEPSLTLKSFFFLFSDLVALKPRSEKARITRLPG